MLRDGIYQKTNEKAVRDKSGGFGKEVILTARRSVERLRVTST